MKCRDCKGKKTYLGAGMYSPEPCRHCGGTGEEPAPATECEIHGDKSAQIIRDGAGVFQEYAPKSARLREKCPKLQEAYPVGPGQVTYGLTDHQRAEVQEMLRENVEPLNRQIGALQQEVARLREPRSRPEELVISNVMEIEPGVTCRIPLQPMNGGCESYALQRMLVSAMPVDLVDTNGENIELPVIIECRGTMSRYVPILLADVVSTAGLLEVSGLIGARCDQELTVQVKNPTNQKVRVTATVWVVERKPEPPTRFPDRCHG